jgi:hypothetical protein
LRDNLMAIEADEIGDWAFEATCTASAKSDDGSLAVPSVISLEATVFASGDVFIGIHFEGVESALWIVEPIDLNLIDSVRAGEPS